KATYQSYSMSAVVRSALESMARKPPLLDPHLFKDKIVFVGTNAAGTYDLRVTPLSPYASGVLIHMAALDNLLQGRFLSPASWPIFALSTLFLCLLTAWSFVLSRTQLLKVGSMAAIFLLYLGIVTIAFATAQLWLQTVVPLGAQGVTFAVVATVEYFTEGRTRRQLRLAFDKYMSAEVVDEIMRAPESIVLGGEQRELTVLFSDVAGFTTISEQLAPQELVTLLNRYLSAMGAVIRLHRGNVNKYLGDGIMAIFGAPLRDPDHAALACRAALGMQRTLVKLSESLQSDGYPLIHARIGISTGPLIVGNVGSEERLEYTVIGDTVNLASRLEGANKYYGTGILIGPRAYELAKGEIEARPVDFLRVKGKTQPVLAYELMGMAGELDATRRTMLQRYTEGFETYRSRGFAQARICFATVLADHPEDSLTKMYYDRATRYQATPPPVDWDGVFDLKFK
ncbi:MAG: CHASE2 domain-containing protein, partial [Nitrospira sp.]|nr:CHASE2 domain-containing protein [Nitrospira sp.]